MLYLLVSIDMQIFTRLGFGFADAIDVAVDLVLGQGGRARYAAIAYDPY